MTSQFSWSYKGAALLIALGGVGLLLSLVVNPDAPLRLLVNRYARWWERRLAFLRLSWSPRSVAWFCVGAPASLVLEGVLVRQAWLVSAGGALALLPAILVERARKTRLARIDAAVEPWLSSLANALGAMPSLGEALASTVKLLAPPMCDELELMLKEYELGTPLDLALESLATRVASPRLRQAVWALKLARNAGGNLPRTLDDMCQALRELERLEGVLRSKTAEGRMQAWVVGGLPLPLVGVVHVMDSAFLAPLFDTSKGQLVIGVGVLLWASALLLARKILNVEV